MLKKFRSDKRVRDGYARAVADLAECDDPSAVGRRKSGRLGACYSYTITRSYRLLYTLDRRGGKIRIIDIGDHRGIFGRDNRA